MSTILYFIKNPSSFWKSYYILLYIWNSLIKNISFLCFESTTITSAGAKIRRFNEAYRSKSGSKITNTKEQFKFRTSRFQF